MYLKRTLDFLRLATKSLNEAEKTPDTWPVEKIEKLSETLSLTIEALQELVWELSDDR